MTIIGVLLLIVGGGSAILMLTGIGGDLLPLLNKMPLGIIGWVIVAVVGGVLMMLNRRPGD